MTRGRKIVVVGGGGREHALALRLLESDSVGEVLVCPGNPGTARAPVGGRGTLRNARGSALEVAEREQPDLVVIGPEAPLCDGLVDELGERGVLAYGPGRAAARLEGSKAFTKDFAERHGIPTARHVTVSAPAKVRDAVASFDEPPVVKADGLAAGKGVIIPDTHERAVEAAAGMLSGDAFGAAGRTVVLEQRLLGWEASVHAICDGQRFVVLPAARDHKRVGEGDTGPNTGGMGTYAPAPRVTAELMARIERDVIQRAVTGMLTDGSPFRGTLFAGLMISPTGEIQLLEFNVRFGDPETQVLMNVIAGDFAEALASAAAGELDASAIRVTDGHAVCVVMAASGYPGSARKGDAITGIADAEAMSGVRVYQAGTRLEGDSLQTAGGRVLGVTARGASLSEARASAYRAVDAIHFDGAIVRRDIAAGVPT